MCVHVRSCYTPAGSRDNNNYLRHHSADFPQNTQLSDRDLAHYIRANAYFLKPELDGKIKACLFETALGFVSARSCVRLKCALLWHIWLQLQRLGR